MVHKGTQQLTCLGIIQDGRLERPPKQSHKRLRGDFGSRLPLFSKVGYSKHFLRNSTYTFAPENKHEQSFSYLFDNYNQLIRHLPIKTVYEDILSKLKQL